MSSHIRQPSILLVKSLKQKMIKRKLFDSKYQLSELYCVLKKFIDVDMVEYVSWVDGEGVKDVVQGVMINIQREMVKERLLIRVWMKVFIVHGVFGLIIKNNHQVGTILFPYLIQKLTQCHNELRSNHSTSQPQPRQSSLISRSISKIKRSLSSNSIKRLFGSTLKNQQSKISRIDDINIDWENKKVNFSMIKDNQNQSINVNNRVNNFVAFDKKNQRQKHEENKQQNGIEKALQNILHQYIKYLQKLLTDWPSLHMSLFPYIIRFQLCPNTSPFIIQPQFYPPTTQIIWKVLNYFHILSRICKDFHKICQLIQGYYSYMYGTINFIAEDLHLLYNPVADFLMVSIKSINWDEIIKIVGSAKDKRSLEKFNNNKKAPLSKKLPPFVSQHIMQLKTMIQQIGNANQVVLFIFNGYQHSRNIVHKRRPKSFISLNDKRFDIVFQVARRIEQKGRKNMIGLQNKRQNSSSVLSNKMDMNRSVQKKKLNPEQSRKTFIQQQQQSLNQTLTHRQPINSSINKLSNSNQNNNNTNMTAVKYKANKLKQMMKSNLNVIASSGKQIQLTQETDIESSSKV